MLGHSSLLDEKLTAIVERERERAISNLVCPPPPAKPHILFTDDDSVSLTTTKSTADFNFLSANHPWPVRALRPHLSHFLSFFLWEDSYSSL
ncbi:hypothetical protein TIFTF001_024302 [Ficus carica]|uniref:Uncharacterized protein n=1 Tax=Ficus carica TaxID=3494 RepID=A0AA88AGE3_FICCA|nr:hypothetical protein TIFTF001_024302 [Ficus carica]